MQEQLYQRLEVLKEEFTTGQVRLQELEMQQGHWRLMLLRISGAIQVLEELLAQSRHTQETTKLPAASSMTIVHE